MSGIELTGSFEDREFHILGVGIDHENPLSSKMLDVISSNGFKRSRKMFELLENTEKYCLLKT